MVDPTQLKTSAEAFVAKQGSWLARNKKPVLIGVGILLVVLLLWHFLL